MPPIYKTGVYLWKNEVNGKVYVGGAYKCLIKRKLLHVRFLNAKTHSNRHFQAAWNKYGEAVFTFSILERCSVTILLGREQYWIDYYDAANQEKGYNIAPIAGSTLGVKHPPRTQEYRSRVSDRMRGVPKSSEHRKKIGLAHKGKTISLENLQKLAAVNSTRVRSVEEREKRADIMRRKWENDEYRKDVISKITGKKRTQEQIARVVAIHKGSKRTDETKRNISLAKRGCIGSFKGRKHSQETKEKMRLRALERSLRRKLNNINDGSEVGLQQTNNLFTELTPS